MRVNHREDDLENHDIGLDHDLPRMLHRRGMLQLVAGASLITLAGCSAAATTETTNAAPGGAPPAGGGSGGGSSREVSDGEIPEETAGPYPGDGSNGTNVLTESGVVRSDITSSFGSSTTKAEGIPVTVTMTIQEFDADKAAYAGVAVYLWHCNRDGEYSLYSEAIKNENYLRGVQEADDKGTVTFTTIFPAAYDGRWPHMHFEVYPSLAKATSSANKIATSQMAMPEATCKEVYATTGYEQSVTNLSKVTLASDNVFGDGYDLQIPAITGNTTDGYALNLSCAI